MSGLISSVIWKRDARNLLRCWVSAYNATTGMFIRNVSFGLLTILLVAWEAPSQTAKRDCRGAGTITLNVAPDDSYSSSTFVYQLSDPKNFSTAQIEVWDRPKLLFRAKVPVRTRGQIVWTPKEEPADTPFALWIRVEDPEHPNDSNDSRVLIGTNGPVEGGPVPELVPYQTLMVQEGAERPVVTAEGKDLDERNVRILLSEQEGPQIWIAREFLPAALTDLRRIGVQIPAGYLSKPTGLRLGAVRVGDESLYHLGTQDGSGPSMTVRVMSKDRPVFTAMEPSTASAGNQTGATLRILGSGFTTDSQVLVSEGGGIDFTSAFKPTFLSSSELHVTLRDDQLRTGSSSLYANFQLWVRNGDDQHISDPKTLTLLPTPEFPFAGAKRPSITSVSPYPVPLMDEPSSTGIFLKVYGENFKNGDTLIAQNNESQGDGKLRTEFVSPQQLNAWLPREAWRSHRLSFRLMIQASTGTCAAEAWQDW
jgi:hypothetical protein